MSNRFPERVKNIVSNEKHLNLVISDFHAYGMLVDALERFWNDLRYVGTPQRRDPIDALVHLAACCQQIAENCFGFEPPNESDAEYYKAKYNKVKLTLDKVLGYIKLHGVDDTPLQQGKTPCRTVTFEPLFLEGIKERMKDV